MWEERLEILNNPEIKECYFESLPTSYSNLCYYCDFQKGGNWVNTTCEWYYNKDIVDIK